MKYCVTLVPLQGEHHMCLDDVGRGVHRALLDLGHESTYGSRPAPDATNVILGAHALAPGEVRKAANPVVYNLEQLNFSQAASSEYLKLLTSQPGWDYARDNALKHPGAAYVPVGYSPEWDGEVPHAETNKTHDVIFYGSLDERRKKVLDECEALGLRVLYGFGLYGAARARAMAKAKVVLNMHYGPYRIFQSPRVAYALANACAVVSEPGLEMHFSEGMQMASYEDLAHACAELAKDEEARLKLSVRGYDAVRAVPMEHILERVVGRG